jgi:enoyl-CoA hydratase
MSDVIVRIEGGVGRLTLNRPQALHALTTQMCADMIQALLAWRTAPDVALILIDHAPGTRGFCAGGDIRMLAESGRGDGRAAREFFFMEYRLNHLLHEYAKPVVAIIDGVTMGGGVGISVHGAYCVATERTSFAMPETGIGLFPDVGGGWFLPRLEGEIGVWLALTGVRLKAADCLAAGVATHFVDSASILELVENLRAIASTGERRADARARFSDVLDRFASDAGGPAELTAENRARVARLFAHDRVEDIFSALAGDASDWARAQLATLRTKSPQTLKVALRQIRTGASLASFAENMRMEYRIGARVVRRHDFAEGVRAAIVEKDNAPKWSPRTIEEVTEAMLDGIFAPLPTGEEWTPLPP